MYTVLLYYKFVEIENPEKFRESQFELCTKLGLKGRILIAKEGLNGTVGGTREACDEYIQVVQSMPEFKDIEWKISTSQVDPFPKLRVVVRDEIVTFKTPINIDNRAEYINPNELLDLYEKGEDFVIIDGRNEYEGRIGKFKNAIVPDINNFREFPEWLEKNRSKLIGKTVVTYCTGGIRCEKLSAYLIENGLEDVKQLHGGIHRYSDEVGGKYFEGEMYVFDNRIHVPVNFVNPETISECHHCSKKVARFINCCNAECNKQFICCEDCDIKFESGCSVECQSKSRFKIKLENGTVNE
jgi:UPF0176 protein